MLEKGTRAFKWVAIFGWVFSFVQAHAQSTTDQPTVLFKKAAVDGASKGADKVLIEAGPLGNLRRFEVRRLSDPGKPNWDKYEGQWK
ncbi:MAG: hypothetical protein VCA36_10895, partial [Opitutales bacterium]